MPLTFPIRFESCINPIFVVIVINSRKPSAEIHQPSAATMAASYKFDLGDLPQDLSVHRSHFSALAANVTPAHGGAAGFSGNGNGVGRSALSPLPAQAHLQSPFAALHHRNSGAGGGGGVTTPTGKSPWPKDEIQV